MFVINIVTVFVGVFFSQQDLSTEFVFTKEKYTFPCFLSLDQFEFRVDNYVKIFRHFSLPGSAVN